jgi:hypothetical protein
MITLISGLQLISNKVKEQMETVGSTLNPTKTVILYDVSADLQPYTTVSGLAKQELTTTLVTQPTGVGINSAKILGAGFQYNRLYYLNNANEELFSLKINEVTESDINIDVIVQLGDSDTVTIVNA